MIPFSISFAGQIVYLQHIASFFMVSWPVMLHKNNSLRPENLFAIYVDSYGCFKRFTQK